jgi:hypothetical protein
MVFSAKNAEQQMTENKDIQAFQKLTALNGISQFHDNMATALNPATPVKNKTSFKNFDLSMIFTF